MNGNYKIDHEQFRTFTTDTKLDVIYATLNECRDRCNARFCKLEQRKTMDTTISGATGIIGGIIAVVASRLFKP